MILFATSCRSPRRRAFSSTSDPKRVDRRQEWAERLREGKARLADVIKASDDTLRNELSLTPPPRVFLYIRSEARRSPPGMGRAIARRKSAARGRDQGER